MVSRKVIICSVFFAASFMGIAAAQDSQLDLNISYAKTYQLENSFTFLYDNPSAAVKINEFKFVFFNDANAKIGETEIRSHPLESQISVHRLEQPIIGFSSAKLSIISLYEGDISDLTSAASILALNEGNELKPEPDPEPEPEPVTVSEPEPVPDVETAPNELAGTDISESRLAKFAEQTALLRTLNDQYTSLSNAIRQKAPSDELVTAAQLIIDDNIMRSQPLETESALKNDFNTLTDEIIAAISARPWDQANLELSGLQERLVSAENLLGNLGNLSAAPNPNIDEFAAQQDAVSIELVKLDQDIASIAIPEPITADQINMWQERQAELISMLPVLELPANGFDWRLGLAILMAALGIIAFLLKAKTQPRLNFKQDNSRPKPEKPPKAGVIFAHSPLFAGAAASGPAPLIPSGHMAPAGLQTLTGQYAVLKPAYQATGRIGGPQIGVPTNEDVSFGTGFLITPDHVMTNKHVYKFYKHYLTGPDCGGIEFMAERDRDASDYVPFNGEPPILIEDLDIAIFKLAKAVPNRKPINRVAIPTAELDARDVITISYPCPFDVDDTILSVVEKDPIFAVKRISQGQIFRHTTDTDTPYGVEVSVDAQINPTKKLSAICHNASTLGGSSGAPILDIKGQLVGVHFAGDRAFNGKEAANLAMAIELLANAGPSWNNKDEIA